MTNPRLDAMRAMVARNPTNALARFGLANEAAKEGLLDEALEHLQVYLASYDDEGNGWARAADLYERLGRLDDARDALRKGIEAANRFGHPGMMSELEAKLEELDSA
ncbi:MAG TPA: tetratricopeptide repeat protein [Gemmatimonadaceae bacterium]|jgi:tetratricopeptide (TPR) repeat protein|nr:tetratricopeptide repeat protein [Gemmatimonadaceae bacterium]